MSGDAPALAEPPPALHESSPAAGELPAEAVAVEHDAAPADEAPEWRTESGFFPVDSSGSAGVPSRPCYHYFFKNATKKADALSADDARIMAADFRKHKMFDEAAQADALAEQIERGDLPADVADGSETGEKAEGAPLLDGDPDPRAHIANHPIACLIAAHSLSLFAVMGLVMLFVTLVGCLAFDVKVQYETMAGFKVSSGTAVTNYYAMQAAVQDSMQNAQSLGTPKRELLTLVPEATASRQLLTPVFHTIPPPQQRTATWRIHVIYEARDNVLTHSSMKEIHDLESDITLLPGYGDVCLVRTDGKGCHAPNSAVNVFFPSADTGQQQPILDGLATTMGNASSSVDALLKMGMYWYPGNELTPTTRKSRYLRTEFMFGTPLEGYDSSGSKQDKQKQIYLEFVDKAVSLLEDYSSQNLNVYYGGDGVGEHQLSAAFWHDFALAASAIFVVFIALWLRSNSAFLATSAIIQIMCCQTTAYFIYRGIFGIEYVTVLNALGHLLSAVSVCINTVAFLATHSKTNVVSFDLKLAFAYRKVMLPFCACACASGPALFTLFFNDIRLLQTFGVYTTLIVVINLGLSLTWLPICIAVHEKHLNNLSGPHQWLFGYEKEEPAKSDGEHSAMGDDTEYKPVKDKKPDEEVVATRQAVTIQNVPPSEGIPGLLYNCSEKWFPDWAAFLCEWKWCVISVFGAMLLFSALTTAYFGHPNDLPRILSQSSNYNQYLTKSRDHFRSTGPCQSCGDAFSDSVVGPRVNVYIHSVMEIQGTEARAFSNPDQPGLSGAFIATIKNVSQTSGLVAITAAQDRGTNTVVITFTVATSSIPKANQIVRKLKASIKDASPAGFHDSYVAQATKDPTVDSRFNPSVTLVAGPTTSLRKSGAARLNSPTSAGAATQNSPGPGSTDSATTVDTSEGALLLNSALTEMDYQEPPPTESTLDVYLVWGISGYHSSDTVFPNPFSDMYGTPEFDGAFDLAKTASQRALHEVCKQLKNEALVQYVIRCPIEDFAEWVTTQKKSDTTMHKFPTNAVDFYELIKAFTEDPGKEFEADFGFDKENDRVGWTRIHLRSKVVELSSNSNKLEQYEAWQTYQARLDRNYTRELTTSYQTSEGWIDVMTEKAAVDGAKKVLGVAFMFLIAVMTNMFGSLVLALLAAATVAQGVLFTLGMLTLSGWTFGIVESIGICLLAGLLTDYVTHICDSYLSLGPLWHSIEVTENCSRRARVSAAMAHLGPAIVLVIVLSVTVYFFSCFSNFEIIAKVATVGLLSTISIGMFALSFLALGLGLFGCEDLKEMWKVGYVVARLFGSLCIIVSVFILAYYVA